MCSKCKEKPSQTNQGFCKECAQEHLEKCRRKFEKEYRKACKDFHSGCPWERPEKNPEGRSEIAERFTMLCEELRDKNVEEKLIL